MYTLFDARMKEYERKSDYRLSSELPVIVRIDGRCFHSFAKNCKKPFDKNIQRAMKETMLSLCENLQNCVFGYTQSDEISLIIYLSEEVNEKGNQIAQPVFNWRIQKLCSTIASTATSFFNLYYFIHYFNSLFHDEKGFSLPTILEKMHPPTLATFDARVFNIPKKEVCNNIYWRQSDAYRNAIQLIGRAYFSHKELQNVKCEKIISMLKDKQINLTDFPHQCLYGSYCIKGGKGWTIPEVTPLFKNQNRAIINNLINYIEREDITE